MRTLYLLLLLLSVTVATAQSLVDRIADSVCDCMQDAPEIVYPRLQATRCLERVARRYATPIARNLSLSVASVDDRDRLGDLLVDPLTRRCGFLTGLAHGEAEPQLHYSDIGSHRAAAVRSTPKEPPPLPPTQLREGVEVHTAFGTLTKVDPSGWLSLRAPGKATVRIYFSSRQYRQLSVATDRQLELTYRLDWTTDPDRVLRRLLFVK